MTENPANHLFKENSPYLLQHAHNPVDWYPWTDGAIEKAKEENKLLIISIGYSACHWCHVMEHESFEDIEVAVLMNRSFISVKVDREERPDIDHLYMSACQLLGSMGGWPLNVIALPDQRPVFTGTYFSKRDWIDILNYFSDIYLNHPQELLSLADKISQGLQKMHRPPSLIINSVEDPTEPEKIYSLWAQDFDFYYGGTLGAPKFPMPVNLSSLLSYGYLNHNEEACDYVMMTLEKMAMGGIYDHLGGGFSRYSVDGHWKVPHFEKMLYDNAQLISVYAQAFRLTKKDALKIIIEETVDFIMKELTSPEGFFYSSLDADSESIEGAFYTWHSDQLYELLGPDATAFMDYFSCTETGNWEQGLNILRKKKAPSSWSEESGILEIEIPEKIIAGKQKLLNARNNRVRPRTDDKILTGWNGLMISGLLEAYRALNSPELLEKAIITAFYYREHVLKTNGNICRNFKDGRYTIPGFLDDYAFLIKAFLDLYQLTYNSSWLEVSDLLIRHTISHFTSSDGIYFHLSSGRESRLILDTIELMDTVIPSSNARMAENLFILGYVKGEPDLIRRSEKMLSGMLSSVRKNPGFHSKWFELLNRMNSGPVEISIIGKDRERLLGEFQGLYLPQVIFSNNNPVKVIDSMENAQLKNQTNIYICRNKTCFPPVSHLSDALNLIFQK